MQVRAATNDYFDCGFIIDLHSVSVTRRESPAFVPDFLITYIMHIALLETWHKQLFVFLISLYKQKMKV